MVELLETTVKKNAPKTFDFQEVFGEYIGKHLYLAMNKEQSKVLATGDTPLEAIENAKEAGYKKPIIMLAPQNTDGYILTL
ncbi:MAG: DUF5678 domain-containing protein [archaeon]